MSRKRPGSKWRHLQRALGIAGVSLLLAGGASASATLPAPSNAAPQFLPNEHAANVTFATPRFFDEKFRVFAGENTFRIAAGKAGPGAGAGTGSGTGAGSAKGAAAASAYRCRYGYGYGRYCSYR
jgi:hypothetical protein